MDIAGEKKPNMLAARSGLENLAWKTKKGGEVIDLFSQKVEKLVACCILGQKLPWQTFYQTSQRLEIFFKILFAMANECNQTHPKSRQLG